MPNTDPAEISAQLMKQNDVPLWSLYDSPLVESIAYKQPLIRGKKELFIYSTLKLLNNSSLQTAFLLAIGLYQATHWWLKNSGSFSHKKNNSLRIFVGSGAGSEDNLWRAFKKRHSQGAVRINQSFPGGQKGLARISLLKLLKLVLTKSREVTAGHKCASKLIRRYRIDFLTIAILRIGPYCYFYTWWFEIKKYNPAEIIFLTPDAASYGCIDAGLSNVILRQHGLIRRSLVYPKFNVIHAITQEEANFLKTLLPDAEVTVDIVKQSDNTHKNSVVLTTHITKSVKSAEYFVQWAQENGLKVIVRKHPVDQQKLSIEKYPNVVFSPKSESFASLLERERPLFVVSWFSTTLAESLWYNIIPITFIHPNSDEIRDYVYSFHSHALSWPECQHVLERLVDDSTEYQSTLLALSYDG